MNISGHARIAGIVGWPVGHSLSPRLHGFWLREHAIDGAYVPMAVPREQFSAAVTGLRVAGFVGVNVTNPHKEAAFAIADVVDEAAKAAAAANLLLFRNGRIEARNTDSEGFAASVVEGFGDAALKGKVAAVIGAGGAARGVVLALESLGASEIRVFARNAVQADALVKGLKAKARLAATPLSDWPKAAGDVAFLVNATSAGLAGSAPLSLSLDSLPKSAAVCDIVYNPLETGLLKDARAHGHRTLDGLGMLMHQAVPAFAAFFGPTPRVTPALRAELEKALRDGG